MVEQHIFEAQLGVSELLAELDSGAGARELALAKTKLDEAEMWVARSKEMHEQRRAIDLVERHTAACEEAGCVHPPFDRFGDGMAPRYCARCRGLEAQKNAPA